MPRLLAALCMACCAALPAAALDLDALSDSERAAFRSEVRAYLLENPEVLLEAIAALEDRQGAAQSADDAELVARNAEALFDDPLSWVGGNPDGDITVVEFVDYNCGFCRRALPEVTGLLEADPGVRLVMKELPILGPDSELASRFAIAVLQLAGDEAYFDAHERLLGLQSPVSAPAITRIGTEMGLEMEAITARMQDPQVGAVIEANRALAARLGVNGTPTFVVGDVIVRGYVPLDTMRALVEDQREGG